VEDSIPSKQFTAPCLLLNTNGTPKTLRVSSDRYYPLAIDLGNHSSRTAGTTFFVKKRSGQLDHSDDPDSQRSLVVHQSGSDSVSKLVETFSEDPEILAYSHYLCDETSRRPLSWVPRFCARVLQECLTTNTEEALPLYLELRSSVEAMRDGFASSAEAAWDVRLIRTYYESRSRIFVGSTSTRLLSAEFVSLLNELAEKALSATSLDESDILVYMKTGEPRQASVNEGLLGSFLTFYEVPFPRRNADTMDL